MNIATNTANSMKIGDYSLDTNSLNGTLLSQLEDRVSSALSKQENFAGGAGIQAQEKVNPQDIVNYMAQISNQPIAGMNHSVVI